MGQLISSIQRPDSTEVLNFISTSDNAAIQDSWRRIPDKCLLGQKIFLKIFEVKPNLKESFHLQSVPNDLLANENIFVSHAQNFTDFLTAIVGSLSCKNTEAMAVVHARSIGSRHAVISMFDASLFDPDYWMVFSKCAADDIIDVTNLKRNRKIRVQHAWQMLLMRLVLEMKVAFYKELIRIQHAIQESAIKSEFPQCPIDIVDIFRHTTTESLKEAPNGGEPDARNFRQPNDPHLADFFGDWLKSQLHVRLSRISKDTALTQAPPGQPDVFHSPQQEARPNQLEEL